jgi:hypothetical protein
MPDGTSTVPLDPMSVENGEIVYPGVSQYAM